MCIDLQPNAFCMQSLKFRPFVNPEHLRVQNIKFFEFFGKIPKIEKLLGFQPPITRCSQAKFEILAICYRS